MNRYCLTLDLINDHELIKEYEKMHQNVWPEVQASIKASGIENMEIYRFSNRLFMIMEVSDSFCFEKKTAADLADSKVQEWEKLMWKYQKPLEGAKPGEKWLVMEQLFKL